MGQRADVPLPRTASWSTNAREDYVRWCEEMNLDPVNRTLFGIVVRDELKIEKDDKSGRVKYLNIGLTRSVEGGSSVMKLVMKLETTSPSKCRFRRCPRTPAKVSGNSRRTPAKLSGRET